MIPSNFLDFVAVVPWTFTNTKQTHHGFHKPSYYCYPVLMVEKNYFLKEIFLLKKDQPLFCFIEYEVVM